MADSHSQAVADFWTSLNKCTTNAFCGRPYVRISKWTRWLRSKVRAGSYETTQASRLLGAAYKDIDTTTHPITKEQLCDSKDGCLLIFSILLELERGDLIHSFWRREKLDKQLPMDLLSLKSLFESMGIFNWEQFAIDFDERQWKYCAAKLDLNTGRQYPENRIMPFCRRQEINSKGGTAQLWQIEVLEEFVEPSLREAVKNSRYDPGDGLGPRYEFALKAFEDGNRGLFLNEIDAFRALKKQSAIVQYLCEFGHKEKVIENPSEGTSNTESGCQKNTVKTKTTHNIILEYGESDLEEYFAATVPPYLQPEVDAFWRSLFVVADAVRSIHNLKIEIGGRVEEYYGWHADIKPDNILIVHGEFKLADPGFVKFVKKTDKDPAEVLPGGTETFGAPERHPGWADIPSKVEQTIDTWSLGCVFSIAATWVVLGYQGVRQYNEIREKAVQRLVEGQEKILSEQRKTPLLTQGDYFHDGCCVLAAVLDWHDVLRNALRKTDSITTRVLDLVDQKLLLGDPKLRLKADQTCKELKRILKDAQAEPRIQVPENIKELLREVDDAGTSPSKTRGSSVATATPSLKVPTIAEMRKSKFLGPPLLKTTHRSQVLRPTPIPPPNHPVELPSVTPEAKPEVLADSIQIYPKSGSPGRNNRLEKVYSAYRESSAPIYDTVMTQEPHSSPAAPSPQYGEAYKSHRTSLAHSISNTSVASPTRPRLNRRSGTSGRQNVFQAREEIELRDSSHFLSRARKDEFLSRFFENRDIKFLVDNAESMKPFWWEASFVLETLLMKARGQDPNGMDLLFTSGDVNVKNREVQSKLLKSIQADPFMAAMKKTAARPVENLHTNITTSLSKVFKAYLEETKVALRNEARTSKKEKGFDGVKNLTLIILTDGVWAGTQDKEEVRIMIVDFVKKLEKLIGSLKRRPVSIEFIQFGNDVDASYRLRILDDHLKFDGIPDIIDTEHSSGDVIKMLLGSFNPEFDEKEDDDDESNHSTTVPSPTQSQQSFDTFETDAGPSRASMYRPESSMSQSTPRGSAYYLPSAPPVRTPTGQRGVPNIPVPVRQQTSPRPPYRDQDNYRI